ncbi:MAG: glucose-1-phosphate adenylyltransferase subunit GlgD [Chloroflexi bacterium]|nr:glucose-1-phosphate adenylyltransferase subunit GlgD [Chloroflexota bacterium]
MKVLAVVLAGGEGTRLSILSEKRAKPAVPFGGKYRIIDFTLSNCVNSGIYNVAVLTQYRPHSLNDHIGIGRPWDLDRQAGGVRLLQPYLARKEGDWYRGTADAVHQNLAFLSENADTVVILSGDHIYKMDYKTMLDYHTQQNADLTVAVINVSLEEAPRFGILAVNAEQRVINFYEKPKQPMGTLASMGVYVFKRSILEEVLAPDANGLRPMDFGKEVLPAMVAHAEYTQPDALANTGLSTLNRKTGGYRVYAYPFPGYWVDVGTVQSYWEANMALLEDRPKLDLYDPETVIHTRSEERPPVKSGPEAEIDRSLVSNGCIINGKVEHSVLSPGVVVHRGAIVRDSIILTDTVIKESAVLDRVIVDKEVIIGAGAQLGLGDLNQATPNAQEPDRLNTGLTLVGKRARVPGGVEIGRNVLIRADTKEEAFTQKTYESGSTI